MNPVFKKLHLLDKDPVLVLNAPEEYYNLLEELEVEIHDEVEDDYHFVQVFAQNDEEATAVIREVVNSIEPGAYFWFTYPKESSEAFETELFEENVDEIFEMFDLVGVTKVSIDSDWQAIRLKFDEENDESFDTGTKGPRKFNSKIE